MPYLSQRLLEGNAFAASDLGFGLSDDGVKLASALRAHLTVFVEIARHDGRFGGRVGATHEEKTSAFVGCRQEATTPIVLVAPLHIPRQEGLASSGIA